MKFGFSITVRGADATAPNFVRIAEAAEALRVDSLWSSAHVIIPPQGDSGYALVSGLQHPPHWRDGYWEPFAVLNLIAAHTKRVLLGTSVVVLPMHNPFELAKWVAQTDQISAGRFLFGIGVGWFKNEFEVLGQCYENRGKRTDEALALMEKLWTVDPVDFDGEFYRVEQGWFSPKPVQRPYPPIWVAAGSRPGFRRLARYGTYYHPVRVSPERLMRTREAIDKECEAIGRDPATIRYSVKLPLVFKDEPQVEGEWPTQGRVDDMVRAIESYKAIGVDHFVFDVVPESCAVLIETMQRFAEEVRPNVI